MKEYKNLVEAIIGNKSTDTGITFVNSEQDETFISYFDLFQRAQRLLYNLQKFGLKPGDEVVLQLDNNFDFVIVFWACILGKIIPVPVTPGIHDEQILKLMNTWTVLKKPNLVISKNILNKLEIFIENNQKQSRLYQNIREHTIFIEEIIQEKADADGTIYPPDESDLAFIQFSSGSTGQPKGVVLTHKNLAANIRAIIKYIDSLAFTKSMLNWMPLTHDMGLIGLHLTPLFARWPQYHIPSALFIRRPLLWLKKISQHKITITASPNFGYKYLLKFFRPEEHSDLDLSSLRLIFNGAEPISAALCNEFLDVMAPNGLRRNAMLPVYGLAEASLAVTFPAPRDKIVVVNLDRDKLKIGDRVGELDNNAPGISLVELGCPVDECRVRIVNDNGNEVSDRTIGHIEIKGANVSGGYYNNPAATREAIKPGGWLRTGDIGFYRDGSLVVSGRSKDIIFVAGMNLYSHDIERVIGSLTKIEAEKVAVFGVYDEAKRCDEIICCVIFKNLDETFLQLAGAIKKQVIECLGVEIGKVIPVKRIPRTTSGKVQRFKLKEEYIQGKFDPVLAKIAQLEKERQVVKESLSRIELKRIITEIVCTVLEREEIGDEINFFDLGGDSTRALQAKHKLQEALGRNIDDAALFIYPTINALVEYFSLDEKGLTIDYRQKEYLKKYLRERKRIQTKIQKNIREQEIKNTGNNRNGMEIAVIGMSGRFPGASNIADFWENLKKGIESIAFFPDEELLENGVSPQMLQDANYIRAKGLLDGSEYFDHSFFGYSPPEADQMDPQVRVFHECTWEALEDAGYEPASFPGLIGLYAGATPNPAWDARGILSGMMTASQQFGEIQASHKDFMTTKIAYHLSLTGPSVSVYTACSTSLAAVDLACRELLSGKCDLALAGGVSIYLPIRSGYLYEEEMLFSKDGHNRAFDRLAGGTVFSDGAGVVVLRRLADALNERDHIYAVIKGTAVNNDGNRKAGYTAPALVGQAEVIAAALQAADVKPETIGCIEAHGTATILGDTIELEALKLVFNQGKKGICALGSVKSNIGHINSAAGTAGLIKIALALKHRTIPPSLHFTRGNPAVDLENSPFYVNTVLKEWKNDSHPRRAGVSSFGIGGTNVHVVLEEPPQPDESQGGREYKIMMLSAKTERSLDKAVKNLGQFLQENPGVNMADAAYTLQTGRKHFRWRRMFVCSQRDDAIQAVMNPGLGKLFSHDTKDKERTIIFMFPGQGSQYVNMGLGLYLSESLFREEMDRCFDMLKPLMAYDLKEILYKLDKTDKTNGSNKTYKPYDSDIDRTEIAQPIIFVIEYALARLLMSWGIKPASMIGYSFGEYTAACLAGVFSLADAIKLVALRGRLMQHTPSGAMLSVPLPIEELKPLLSSNNRLSIAIDNGPSCIISGTTAEIEDFQEIMKEKRYLCIRVPVSHAGHSAVMTPILAQFEEEIMKIKLQPPRIPFISNVTGKTITAEEAIDPHYWTRHIQETVRFGEGIAGLLRIPNAIFLEIGPGRELGVLVRSQVHYQPGQLLVDLVRHEKEEVDDIYYLMNRIGHSWLYGMAIDWREFYRQEKRSRIPLPTYNFDRQYFPVDKVLLEALRAAQRRNIFQRKPDMEDRQNIPVRQHSCRTDNDKEPVKNRRQRPDLSVAYTAPRNELERKISEIWQEFFGIDSIGVHDNFFELGGDSLKGLKFIDTYKKMIGETVNLNIIFAAPTTADLTVYFAKHFPRKVSGMIRKDTPGKGESIPKEGIGEDSYPEPGKTGSVISLEPVEKKEYYVTSERQKQFFLLGEMEDIGVALNVFRVATVQGEFDRQRFFPAFQRLIERQESLRTSFHTIDGEIVMKIAETVDSPLKYIEWQGKNDREWQEFIESYSTPFDLSRPPLLKMAVVKSAAEQHTLLFDIHHLVFDGTSMKTILSEITGSYVGMSMPALRVQYKEYADWQQKFMQSEEFNKLENYWLTRFSSDTPLLNLPTDFPRPPIRQFPGKWLRFIIDRQLTGKLKKMEEEAAVTLYMILLAVLNILLSKYSGAEDITITSPIMGRKHEELEQIVGLFINLIPMRNFPNGNKTFADFLNEVKQNALAAYENQLYPFGLLIDKLGIQGDFSRNPLNDVELIMVESYLSQVAIEGLHFSLLEYDQDRAMVDISLEVTDQGETISCNLMYCTKLFKIETMERFIDYFKGILETVTVNRNILLRDITISTDLGEATAIFHDDKGNFGF